AQDGPKVTEGAHVEISLRVAVGDMERATIEHPPILGLIHTDLGASDWNRTKMRPRNEHVPFPQAQQHVIDPTHPRRTLDDRIKYRLHVRRRSTDDAEHLRGCRLMLQCLTQFCIALTQFLKEPDVLDSDDGLTGEGFEKFDLLICERSYFSSANYDPPNRDA